MTRSSDQGGPAIATAADGRFLITWHSYYQDDSNWGVYGQRYAADGTPQGSEFRVNTYTYDSQSDPAVAMNADGSTVIAWMSGSQDSSGWGIYAQQYAADGTALGGEFRANTYTYYNQKYPAVAVGAGGNFLVAWQSDQSETASSIQDESAWDVDLLAVPTQEVLQVALSGSAK